MDTHGKWVEPLTESFNNDTHYYRWLLKDSISLIHGNHQLLHQIARNRLRKKKEGKKKISKRKLRILFNIFLSHCHLDKLYLVFDELKQLFSSSSKIKGEENPDFLWHLVKYIYLKDSQRRTDCVTPSFFYKEKKG